MRAWFFIAWAVGAGLGCGDAGRSERRTASGEESAAPSSRASAPPVASASALLASASAPSAPVGSSAAASPAAGKARCAEDMVFVEGEYCPDVDQVCKKHHAEYERDEERREKAATDGKKPKTTVSERCLEYESPTVCRSKTKKHMAFCVDRYEYPNKKGELPAFLISWTEAKKVCAGLGKRLCTEQEFNFACEGPEMLPYTYGFVRDATKCSIDKPYRKRKKKLATYDKCMARPDCKAHLAELDQRLPAGSMTECVSPFGVFDMNGNINEWVELPGKKHPDRSGLKGGWWGPVRGRCRPTVGFHKEDDYGYEEGFRCCSDARPL